ncbi:MAG: class I SAM-dependent methyltransferase [Cyanobacteria bacterium P01_G01_bin.67]
MKQQNKKMKQTFTNSAFWDDRYQDEKYIYGQHPNDFLRDNASLFKNGDAVLTLAEGEGRNAVFLAQHGCKVRGVDFSVAGRAKALQLAQKQGVTVDYDVADLTQYDMGYAKWDGIVSIFCHLSESNRSALYQSIEQALKPRGIFLLESYNKKQLEFDTGGSRELSHLLSLYELKKAFESFEIIVAQDVERAIVEGNSHNGISSVTQFIARKSM